MPAKKQLTPDQARVRLEALCAKAEHCEAEMREKMRAWGISSADAERIMAHLLQQKFVDDARFSSAFARDRARFYGWGKIKIAQALRVKRIAADIVAEALAEIDMEEYQDRLAELLKTKARQISDPPRTLEWRQKLYRFAAQRGFESHLIANAIKLLQ